MNKIYLVSFDNGELVVVYCATLTADEIKRFAEKATGLKTIDVATTTQDQLQYYCIDGRVYADTPELEQRTRTYIS